MRYDDWTILELIYGILKWKIVSNSTTMSYCYFCTNFKNSFCNLICNESSSYGAFDPDEEKFIDRDKFSKLDPLCIKTSEILDMGLEI